MQKHPTPLSQYPLSQDCCFKPSAQQEAPAIVSAYDSKRKWLASKHNTTRQVFYALREVIPGLLLIEPLINSPHRLRQGISVHMTKYERPKGREI